MDSALDPDAALRAIDERRAVLRERIARLDERIRSVRAVRGEWTDEEHDPEGFTTVFEWSQAEGARADHAAELAGLDAAEARVRDGAYGICATCGAAIPAGQLELRPARTACVDCAR